MFRGRLSERGVERGLADFDASRSFANRKTLGDKRLRAPELFVSHDGFASAPATAGHRCIEAGAGSFADEVALELSERTENVKDLNKGEARNALARAVFFHRLGEIRDRTFENQRYRASGLNLAVAAIILWNTVYLGLAVDELRSRGEIIPGELLAHIAPLGWEHIAFNGDYVWPVEPLATAFRPLRNPRA